MRRFSKCIKNNDVTKRTKDQVTSTVNMEGQPFASEAVLVMGKLKEFRGRIPCQIPQNYRTCAGLLPCGTI
jgi:hypothetical protein